MIPAPSEPTPQLTGSKPCTDGEGVCVHMCACVRMCAQCHFPQSGLDFSFFFLFQLISRVQNHEGFCQEEVLGQVKTEHKVAGGVDWPLVLVPSRPGPLLRPQSPGRNREATGGETESK